MTKILTQIKERSHNLILLLGQLAMHRSAACMFVSTKRHKRTLLATIGSHDA